MSPADRVIVDWSISEYCSLGVMLIAFGSGTDPIYALCLLIGVTVFKKGLNLCRLKSDLDDIWQDSSWCKNTSIDTELTTNTSVIAH